MPRVLELGGIALAIVALARPIERVVLPLTTEGIDIVICIDASSSMRANDLDPARTRLEVAKDAAARFVAGRQDDRVGLIRFARYPDVVCPLTRDHAALARLLGDVAPIQTEGPEDATGIGTALARAAQLLGGSDAGEEHETASAPRARVAILFTDGEENVATAQTPDEIGPGLAARACRELGVRVWAIAAGTDAVDTTEVDRAVATTGGRLFFARDAAAVSNVYAEISALERAPLADAQVEIEERFLPFLLAAFTLLVASRVLDRTAFEVLP